MHNNTTNTYEMSLDLEPEVVSITGVTADKKLVIEILQPVREIIECCKCECRDLEKDQYLLECASQIVSNSCQDKTLAAKLLQGHREVNDIRPVSIYQLDNLILAEVELTVTTGYDVKAWYLIRKENDEYKILKEPSLVPLSPDMLYTKAISDRENKYRLFYSRR